jgi:hypothetical protein
MGLRGKEALSAEMQCFVGLDWLELFAVGAGIPLITQRSVVQIHPPQ